MTVKYYVGKKHITSVGIGYQGIPCACGNSFVKLGEDEHKVVKVTRIFDERGLSRHIEVTLEPVESE